MSSSNVTINCTTKPQIQVQTSKNKQQPQLIPSDELKDEDPFVQNITQLITNSVVINKKLHRQILEKQYHMKTENQEVSYKMTNIYRQMEELYHKTQNFYQETVRQNQKARYLAQELIKPFREQLRNKVDQTTLSLKMKLLLNEFDNLGHKISYDKEGKVTAQVPSTIEFIKKELLPIITSLQSRIYKLETNEKRSFQKIDQSLVHLSQMQSKISQLSLQVEQRKKDSLSWKQKQESLKQQIKVASKQFNNSLTKHKQQLNVRLSLANKQTSELKAKLQRDSFNILNAQNNNRPIQQKYIQQMKQLVFENLSEVRTQLEKVKTQVTKNAEQLVVVKSSQSQKKEAQIKGVIQENKKIRESLAQFSAKVQEQALNNINKAVIAKVHKIQADSKIFQTFFKNYEKKISYQQKELISVKNLLAQKANFSDFVRTMEMKADREDYRHLKDLIHHQNQSFSGLKQPDIEHPPSNIQQNNSFIGFKLRNRKSSNTQRKLISNSPSSIQESTDKQDSVKKYMLGFESPAQRKTINDNRSRILFVTQSDKRKWMKAAKDGSEGK